MEQKKISKQDYERFEYFAAAVNDLQHTMSMLNHHIEVLKRTGDVDSLIDFNKSIREYFSNVVYEYKHSLSDE